MTLAETGTGRTRRAAAPKPGAARAGVSRLLRGYRGDLAAVLVYLAGGWYVTARLWHDLGVRVLAANPGDNTQFEWMLAHGARVVFAGENPFFTHRLNVPDGVNLMANTSVLGVSVPLAPITWLAGPDVSFALFAALALAVTAVAWYFVLCRHVVENRLVAFAIAGFCGFAPGLIAHAAGQPNLAAQFLLPIIGARVIGLARPGTPWLRNGAIVGLLVIWQVLINEELLLFTGLALLIFLVVYGLSDRTAARAGVRPLLSGLVVAAVVAGAALAYPLYVQFAGPGRYQGLPFDPSAYSTDLATYFTYSRESLGGGGGVPPRFVDSPNEENAFLGWPVLALAVLFTVWRWRDRLVRAAAVTALVFVLLSLGARPMVHGIRVPVPGLYAPLSRLPFFDLVTPTRLSLVVVGFVGLILARGLDQAAARMPRPAPARSRGGRTVASARVPQGGRVGDRAAARRVWAVLWVTAAVAALLPVFPTPLSAIDRPAVPAFFTSGGWQALVPPGRSVVPVPLPTNAHPAGMWWQANARLDFPIAGGYFLGPSGPADKSAIFGPPPRPTAALLTQVQETGEIPVIGPTARQQAVADLRFWRAAIMVLGSGGDREEALWVTVTDLVGAPPQWRDGVWVWDVRATS